MFLFYDFIVAFIYLNLCLSRRSVFVVNGCFFFFRCKVILVILALCLYLKHLDCIILKFSISISNIVNCV